MEAYTDFAQVYDELMDDTPYEEWCDFLLDVFQRYGVDDVSKRQENANNDMIVTNKNFEKPADAGQTTTMSAESIGADLDTIDEKLRQERNTVLDLGCGTGTLTELLARRGYVMIGVDNAEEMLQLAIEKREQSGLDITYVLQDMRELELYSTVGAVVSVCDSLNYLLDEEDIVQTFERVNNYLYPQGIFVFDYNTVYKYQTVIGDAVIAENREDCSFIWENYYHEDEEINEYDLTVFVAEGQAPQRFRRFQEVHYQRGYRLSQMRALLERAGLEFLEALDADTHGEVRQESERIYVVARKGAGTTANQTIAKLP